MGICLNAMERTESAKKIRKQGYVPCNIYGPGVEAPLNVQIQEREVNRFLRHHSLGAKTRIKVDGKELFCVVKGIQYENIHSKPIHMEFYASAEDKPVKVKVPLKFKGRELLSRGNLVLSIHEDEIAIQGRLKNLPETVDIDVSTMKEGDVLVMEDIPLPEGVRLLSPKEDLVASVGSAFKLDQEVLVG